MTALGYVMEDAREAHRLAAKADAQAWVDHYIAQRLRPRMRVLDVGCGPAVIAREIACRSLDVEVVAVDASEQRLEVACQTLDGLPNAEAVKGDAAALPFADTSFDLVYSRFLFEYLQDKEAAARELARVCRPGGAVLLQDLDGQLVNHFPPDPELETGLASAFAALAPTGFDPFVGRKLRHLLCQAGLESSDVAVEPYHLIVGAIDAHHRRLWKAKLDIAASALARRGLSHAEAIAARFLDYLDREDTTTFSLVFTAVARKPARP